MYSYFPTIDITATGKNIIKLRKARGLTVKDIQKFFGFEEPQAVYKWQQGKSLPTVDNLFALSVLLGVPMEAILVSTNQNYKDEQAVKPAHCFFIFGCLRCVRSSKIYPSFFVRFKVRNRNFQLCQAQCLDKMSIKNSKNIIEPFQGSLWRCTDEISN